MASPGQVNWTPVDVTARNAIVVTPLEIGLWCRVLDTGLLHQAIAAGAGASKWSVAASESAIDTDQVGNESGLTGTTLTEALDDADGRISGLEDLGPVKNHSAAADPTANDDSGDGYSIGSVWINTADDGIFICTDATATAAVWKELAVV